MKKNLYKAQFGGQGTPNISKTGVEDFILQRYDINSDPDTVAYELQDAYGLNYDTALDIVLDVLSLQYGIEDQETEENVELVPDREVYLDEDTFGKRYEYPTLNEDSMALDENEWSWDDTASDESFLNEEVPQSKKGGSISKSKFAKKVVKGLRKAAEGMEQESNEATTNDIPIGGRKELISNFKRSIKDLGNEFYAKEMYDGMPDQEETEDLAQWGGARRTARKAARDWRKMFGQIPVGMFGPGVPNYLGFIVPGQQMSPQMPQVPQMTSPFPGVNINYTKTPFRGRSLSIEGMPPFMFMPGIMMPQQQKIPYNYPGEVIRTRVPVEESWPTVGQKRRDWEKSQGIKSDPRPRNGDILYYYDATWDGEKWVEPTKAFGGPVMHPQPNMFGQLQRFVGGGEDMSAYSAYSENDIDTKDVTDPYYEDGGYLPSAQFGNQQQGFIKISPFDYHGETPGMYRFDTENPTFNIGYSQPLGKRARNFVGADSISAGLTTMLPYKNNTGVGIQGNIHTDFDEFQNLPARVEGDLLAGYDPNLGGYASLMSSPQFMFGNVPQTVARRYGTGLKSGEFMGSIGPFAGASYTPNREYKNERIAIPAGVKGNIDFGIGRKGIKAGLSGYAGADMMGTGLQENKDSTGKLIPKYNYGLQANLKIPINPVKDYARNLLDLARERMPDNTSDNTNYRPRLAYGGLTKAQNGIIISDPYEYEYRKGMYDDSLALYNAYNLFQNTLRKPNQTISSLGPLQGRNQGWGPRILPNNPYSRVQPTRYYTYYQGSQPWQVAEYEKPVQPVFFEPEIGRLPIKTISQPETPELIERNLMPEPIKYDPIRFAKRLQTIMEPDPNKPGEYKIKDFKQVPYSAYFPGEGWQPMDAPGVVWINEKGEEVYEDPTRNKKSGGLIKFQGTGPSQTGNNTNDYDAWLRQKAEREALSEYNDYMNRQSDGSQSMVNYNADPNDPVYQRILERKLQAQGISSGNNTNTNTQQQQQQPQFPYSTGYTTNPFANLRDMFSIYKKNPMTGQNYDFMWMSQQGPARLADGQTYQPAGQQTQQTQQTQQVGQPAQTNTDYFAKALEDYNVSKEDYDAAKAAYKAGSHDSKQLEIINKVEDKAQDYANLDKEFQYDPSQPGYVQDFKLNKAPWWKGGKQTLTVTNRWMDPNDPTTYNQQQQQDNTLTPRQQRSMNKYMGDKNYKRSLFPEKVDNKMEGGDMDLYRFIGTGMSQVSNMNTMNFDPIENNISDKDFPCTDSEKLDPNSPCYDANFKPTYSVDYNINKARTLDLKKVNTLKYALGYGAKGVGDAMENLYQNEYLGNRTASDNMFDPTQMITPGGVSGLNQRSMAPTFTGIVGEAAYKKQGGQTGYEKGGIYDLTKEEIGAILAAGGQIEFL